jgi:hypothetical protein
VLPYLFRCRGAAVTARIAGAVLAVAVSTATPSAPVPQAATLQVSTIDFAPAVLASLHNRYGDDETAVLRSAIVTAVSRATEGVTIPPGLGLTVTVRDIAPSHPTRRQLSDDPAIDVTRTKYIGGADLGGEVRDAHGHVVASVMYRYYPLTLGLASASLDPWADARLAIDQFAAKLAAALRRISPGASPST